MSLAARKLIAARALGARSSFAASKIRAGEFVATVVAIALVAAGSRVAAAADVTHAAAAAAVAIDATRPAGAAAVAATGAPASDLVARVQAGFTPENRRYARVSQTLALLAPLGQLAFALLLLVTGVSARLRDAAHRWFRRRYGRVLVYVVLAGLVAFACRLPLAAFRDYWWEHRFGLSNQSAPAWFADELKALGMNLALFGGTGLIALALWGVESAGRRWWLWLAGGTLPVAVAAVLLQPLVFEPAFNHFEPLGDAPLDHRILALARRAGIPARHVFQVDRSRQTRTVNAYVSGFGPSQRIVLWDTTLQRLSHDEILFVMGHEMGHYKLRHLWQGIALVWLASFVLLFLAARILDRVLRRWGPRWGVTSLADEAALPLFAAVLGALLLVVQPAANAWSRRIEHEADAFGLEVTRLNEAAARTFVEFGEMNRSDPDPPPLLRFLLYTHPPLLERVRFALGYRPWQRGEPNRFFHGAPPASADTSSAASVPGDPDDGVRGGSVARAAIE